MKTNYKFGLYNKTTKIITYTDFYTKKQATKFYNEYLEKDNYLLILLEGEDTVKNVTINDDNTVTVLINRAF